MPWYGSHSFLNEYIIENKCRRIMEIGVLDGENAKTMIENAKKNSALQEIEYYGFDFFSGSTSSLAQIKQKLDKTGCKFKLFKGDTIDILPQIIRKLPKMDLIFIDGGKSYDEAKNDWEHSKNLMHDKTVVFIHNYSFSGVRKMINDISRHNYHVEIIHPSDDADTVLIKKC